jgi:AcrR family transcriptional regulator
MTSERLNTESTGQKQTTDLAQPRRGRQRSQKARDAILAAAGDLLLGHGLDEVSMDAVARHAGVSKATIYRWWPTKEALALDTLYHEWDPTHEAAGETGSLRSDLLSHLRPWVRRARKRPAARIIAALVAEVHKNPQFADRYRAQFVEPRREPPRTLLRKAIERGEIPAVDTELALDLIFGPIYHRLLHAHAPLNDRFIENVVDTVLAGLMSTPAPTGPGAGRSRSTVDRRAT